jgi:hypothetical protein
MNTIKDVESITIKVKNIDTDCFITITFKLVASTLPIANTVSDLIGCDENNDGISEYFDTSNIHNKVVGDQTGMLVTYFYYDGNKLPSPLPNPYTNSTVNFEKLTVRVTHPQTKCYSEISSNSRMSSKPQSDQPQNLYACDEGNGFSHFYTSTIESQIIGNQTGLKLTYTDDKGNQLPSPLPLNFKNSVAQTQIIYVKVENQLNLLCYSETNF